MNTCREFPLRRRHQCGHRCDSAPCHHCQLHWVVPQGEHLSTVDPQAAAPLGGSVSQFTERPPETRGSNGNSLFVIIIFLRAFGLGQQSRSVVGRTDIEMFLDLSALLRCCNGANSSAVVEMKVIVTTLLVSTHQGLTTLNNVSAAINDSAFNPSQLTQNKMLYFWLSGRLFSNLSFCSFCATTVPGQLLALHGFMRSWSFHSWTYYGL